MAFSPPEYCRLFVQKKAYQGGGGGGGATGTPRPPLATPLYFEKGCRKNVHATIPKGNMGYDRYTVPGDCSCRTYFCCFQLALANTFHGLSCQFFQISLKNSELKSHPQCLSGLSRALFPTTFLEIAVYLDASRLGIFCDVLSLFCAGLLSLLKKKKDAFAFSLRTSFQLLLVSSFQLLLVV